MYTISKEEAVILANRTEEQVRSFAGDLNEQINWKKQCMTAPFETIVSAMSSNGYTVTEE